MNRTLEILKAVALTAGLGTVLVGCGRSGGPGAASQDAAASAARAAQVVTLVTVQRRDLPVDIEVPGTVVSLNTVDLRPQVSTTVREVVVREGQQVRRGDLLFRFDDRADQANLAKARAQWQRDRAALADLERQHQRAVDLRAQNFIAQSAVDTVLSALEAQRAAVQADQAAVQAAEVAVSLASLRSPLDGRAGAISVHPGALVTPGSAAPLVTVSQIDPIGVSFAVPEAQLAAVLRGGPEGQSVEGAPLRVLLPGAATRRGPLAGQVESLVGRVNFIDNAVDTASGTVRVKGALANAGQRLWPGQYVSVRLTLRTLKDASVLPMAALMQRGPERNVYVVGDDQLAALRPVKLLHAAGELAAVEGLRPGERVVLEGKQNLRPGGAVREAPQGPTGGVSAASGVATGASR